MIVEIFNYNSIFIDKFANINKLYYHSNCIFIKHDDNHCACFNLNEYIVVIHK